MAEFSNNEEIDMIMIYGLAEGNSGVAQRLYAERFPNRRLPYPSTFTAVVQRGRDYGIGRAPRARGRSRIAAEVEEQILEHAEENPDASVRTIAAAVGVGKTTVHKILREDGLHPFHFQKVQALNAPDYLKRRKFARKFLRMMRRDNSLLERIMFTDEATFDRNGVFNQHNSHVWAHENPHVVRERSFQQRFSVNVWVGIIADEIIGPIFLPRRLTGEAYLQFIRDELPQHLDNVPLHSRINQWWMQDGAPPHFAAPVKDYLTETYGNRWIGRGGPVQWPPRSPDLNPLDFFFGAP